MLKTVNGDLLKASEDAIGHGANCKKTMGSGVAAAIRSKWPQVYQADVDYVGFSGKHKIGHFSSVDIKDKTVYNIYTQVNYLPRGQDHFEYEGFKIGLTKVCEDMKKNGKKSLALPKIGAGLAGGNWHDIKKIIKSVSEEQEIVFVIYEL